MPLSRPVAAPIASHFGALATLKVSASPFASDAVGWNEYSLPSLTLVGGVPLINGAAFGTGALLVGAATTVTANGPRKAIAVPSVTEITRPPYVPSWPDCGLPERRPVARSKASHSGTFTDENASVSPSLSLALGVKS